MMHSELTVVLILTNVGVAVLTAIFAGICILMSHRRSTRARACILVIALAVALAEAASGAEIHVRPDGDDAKSGADKVQAVRSIDKGLALLRSAPAPRKLVLHEGTWEDVKIILTPGDSGLEIAAAPGETPRLLGGKILKDWKPDGEGLVAAAVPGAKERTWDFRCLVVDGKLAPRARLPETGWFEHETKFEQSLEGNANSKVPPELKLHLKYKAGDVGDWLSTRSAELTILHEWDDSQVGVKEHDAATRTLVFSSPSFYPPGAFKNQKWCLWNVREGLTKPGQWYLDRDREVVVYRPRPGGDMAALEVIAPTQESIIRIHGDAQQQVQNVHLSGIRLMATTPPLNTGGWAAMVYAGAVDLEHTRDCVIEDLGIYAVGTHGIFDKASTATQIRHNSVRNVGCGGIYAQNGSKSVVADNTVEDLGLLANSAIGIRVVGVDDNEDNLRPETSMDNRVEHNRVSGGPYAGIEYYGLRNVYEHNLVERVMLVLRDGAGFYGAGKNIVVRANVIRDIPIPGGKLAHGIYIDKGGTDITYENNVILDCPSGLLMNRCSKNRIVGNLFASSSSLGISFFNCKDFTMDNNVFFAAHHIWAANNDAATSWAGSIAWSGTNDYKKNLAEALQRQNPGIIVPQGGKDWSIDPSGKAAHMLPGIMDVLTAAGPRTKAVR